MPQRQSSHAYLQQPPPGFFGRGPHWPRQMPLLRYRVCAQRGRTLQRASLSFLTSFGPGAAPAFACHQVVAKDSTTASALSSLALIQNAATTALVGSAVGVLFSIDLRAVSFVAKCLRLLTGFQHSGWRLSLCLRSFGRYQRSER